MMALGVALVMYVKARSFLAVDQLVRIYREVSQSAARQAVLPHQSPFLAPIVATLFASVTIPVQHNKQCQETLICTVQAVIGGAS